ncbi:MAG: hypothetical protein H6961_01355 [Chromatiaceae bacterium]|nr:hypothetical protein [Chromatiaceae bacterium]HPE79636.1 hypothetical protein [Gammaproteobacteria bacterium]
MIKFIAIILTAVFATGVSAYDGLRDGEREMLNRMNAKEDDNKAYKRYRYERDNANHIGYGDRKRIKDLEYRKRGLNVSLSKGKRTYGETAAIREQIRGIDRQIEQLSAPKY